MRGTTMEYLQNRSVARRVLSCPDFETHKTLLPKRDGVNVLYFDHEFKVFVQVKDGDKVFIPTIPPVDPDKRLMRIDEELRLIELLRESTCYGNKTMQTSNIYDVDAIAHAVKALHSHDCLAASIILNPMSFEFFRIKLKEYVNAYPISVAKKKGSHGTIWGCEIFLSRAARFRELFLLSTPEETGVCVRRGNEVGLAVTNTKSIVMISSAHD